MTERPVIATMASVDYGAIPRSKIKAYAEDDLGLNGDEVNFLISVMRRAETKSRATTADPEMTDQATDAQGVRKILDRNAKPDKNSFHGKKPKVRHPRS